MKKKLNIFIGSSSNYLPSSKNKKLNSVSINEEESNTNPKLINLFRALEKLGHIPIPWWKKEVWKYGESFWDSINRASKIYDAGIFIFGPDDPIDSRKTTKNTYVTRGNVLIEFGLFRASKGKYRTLAIYDKGKLTDNCILNKKNSKLEKEIMNKLIPPTDLTGIEFPSLDEDVDILAGKINEFYEKHIEDGRFDNITYYFGNEIAAKHIRKEYLSWKTKSLYVGLNSAILWDNIESNPGYEQKLDLVNSFLNKLQKNDEIDFNEIMKSIDNVVSFRPGNGLTDSKVITQLGVVNNDISYIPIDFNPMIVFKAVQNVNRDGLINVPFTIIEDFEDHYKHIKYIIEGKAHEIGKANLFMMLGVTFSNFEEDESEFFLKLTRWMDASDYFLFDALIKKEPYNNEEDIKEFSAKLLNKDPRKPDYKSFLINALKQKYSSDNNGTNINFGDTRFVFGEIEKSRIGKYSVIDKTTIIECSFIRDETLPSDVLFIAKRYSFEELKREIEKHFTVIDSLNGLKDDSEVDRGIFLLTKKGRFSHK